MMEMKLVALIDFIKNILPFEEISIHVLFNLEKNVIVL